MSGDWKRKGELIYKMTLHKQLYKEITL